MDFTGKHYPISRRVQAGEQGERIGRVIVNSEVRYHINAASRSARRALIKYSLSSGPPGFSSHYPRALCPYTQHNLRISISPHNSRVASPAPRFTDKYKIFISTARFERKIIVRGRNQSSNNN